MTALPLHGCLREPRAIVIGASAGAVTALSCLLPPLAADFPLAILVTVHVPADKPNSIPALLRTKCRIAIKEAEDKEPIVPGTVYFAPPDYHLLVERDRRLS
ncbi:MAG: chemotaxis protein CheB, partial [Nitrospira sp.]